VNKRLAKKIQQACRRARRAVGKMSRAERDTLYKRGLEIINSGSK
jgi:hypothetical protein